VPLTATYTEAMLAVRMLDELGSVATLLGWDEPEHVQHAVNKALRAYGGLATIADATDPEKLEALADREAWRLAEASLAALYDVGGEGQTLRRSQVYEHVRRRLAAAEARASSYDSAELVGVGQVTWIDDSYSYLEDEYRAI
jgi:hypothetical protein